MPQRDLGAKTQRRMTVHRQPADEREEEEEAPAPTMAKNTGVQRQIKVEEQKDSLQAAVGVPSLTELLRRMSGR